jgi:hypothetical protein
MAREEEEGVLLEERPNDEFKKVVLQDIMKANSVF